MMFSGEKISVVYTVKRLSVFFLVYFSISNVSFGQVSESDSVRQKKTNYGQFLWTGIYTK